MELCKRYIVGKDYPMMATCDENGRHFSGIVVYKDKDGNLKVKVGLEDTII